MQKITPHLWYDKEAGEAARFYASIFPDSKIHNITTLEGTPSGSVEILSFDLTGQKFMAISAGPFFKFNPSISFMVTCHNKEEVDALWQQLVTGGKELMALDSYPFNERYGWLEDKYGLSWQIMHSGGKEIKQKITPSLLFTGNVCGKAEEAINFYTAVFHDSAIKAVSHYGKDESPEKEGNVNYASFMIENHDFAAMESGLEHKFAFNEAISFIVNCATQQEIDYYWEKLSAVPEAEQCGWLKDKYGVSWQINPAVMDDMMKNGSKEQIARVTAAFLQMKKFDIAKLHEAYGK